jgi:hypothetical protein
LHFHFPISSLLHELGLEDEPLDLVGLALDLLFVGGEPNALDQRAALDDCRRIQ